MKHELTIGLNDKDLHKQIVSGAEAERMIAEEIGDCTLFPCRGIYHGEAENSYRLEVYSGAEDLERLIKAAERLCVRLNQECIIVDGQFVMNPGR